MMDKIQDFQKIGGENADLAMKAFGAMSKGLQAIATEAADYSKKSFEEGSAVLEKLMGAKSVDKAVEIQTAYAKTAYEGYVAEVTKLGEMYADLAKEAYKPFEVMVSKNGK
ncbi:MAG TPA: phasin family protein [Hyphomicrobiales bacterium]|nr:phasin family protein [Hyphomicrobiales bacterium]